MSIRRVFLIVILAAFMGAMFAQFLGMGVYVWYQAERASVLSLGKSPSALFCRVMSWVDYYGFTREERWQCESILHPKPVRPTPATPRSI